MQQKNKKSNEKSRIKNKINAFTSGMADEKANKKIFEV